MGAGLTGNPMSVNVLNLPGLKILDFKEISIDHRTGASPFPARLEKFSWKQHCQGLFQTPVAA